MVSAGLPQLGRGSARFRFDHDRREHRLVEQGRLGRRGAAARSQHVLPAGQLRRRGAEVGAEDREPLEHALEVAPASARSRRIVVPSCRFSATDSEAKICRPSGTSAMPRRTIRSGESPTRLSPR
jgi:hypothetical protein